MRALQVTAWQKDPEVREVPDPDPGPGQVVVDVAGSGACHSDLHLLYEIPDGLIPWDLPFTLGHETAGRVAALGPGAVGVEVGEPVVLYGPWGCGHCVTCRQGAENCCEHLELADPGGGGLGLDGGMADKMLVPSTRHLVRLGDLDPVVAAPLADAGLTPYHAIARSLHLLTPGSHAVVIGAGGLGNLAVQILAALSTATVIVVDQRDSALAAAASVGATHTVRPGADAAAEVIEATGGRKAELVLDFVGADETMALGVQVGRSLGHLTIVGIAGGTLPFNFIAMPSELAVATTYWGTYPELVELISLARSGLVVPHIERFPLDRAVDAYRKMQAGELTGRAVIVP